MQEKIAKIAVDIYAMESMAYIVAATIDTHVDHDTALESAIIKVRSQMMKDKYYGTGVSDSEQSEVTMKDD